MVPRGDPSTVFKEVRVNRFVSTLRTCFAAAVVALLCAPSAHARLGTGLFNVYDWISVCLQDDGSWRSDFAGLGGRWHEAGNKLYLFGNYANGAGNDAMVFSNHHPEDFMHNPGTWAEWRDDMSWFTVAPKAFIYKLADTCDGLAATTSPPRSHPLQR